MAKKKKLSIEDIYGLKEKVFLIRVDALMTLLDNYTERSITRHEFKIGVKTLLRDY